VDDTISYLNTDLDLTSADDLTALVGAFEVHGADVLHLTHSDDGLWYTTIEIIETSGPEHQPEQNIAAMLAVVESLGKPLRVIWSGCTRREFNIGYDCGSKPWAFNQGLSSHLLGRIAVAGASLRVTLYPPTQEKNASEETVIGDE
jgi:hypothetical protein